MRAPYAQRAAPEYAGSGPRKLDLLGGSQLADTSTPADTSTARLKYLLRLHALGGHKFSEPFLIRRARPINLHQITHAPGGEVSAGQVLCLGPGHSPKDRSLAVWFGRSGKIICHSLAGPSSSLTRRKPETRSRALLSPSWSEHCWEAAMLKAAPWWSRKGFPVFPLKPRDKRPLGCLVPYGLPTDPISIERGIGPECFGSPSSWKLSAQTAAE